MEADFETFTPLGTKEAKASFSAEVKTVFRTYSLGANSNRDDWVFNFDAATLESNVRRFIAFYNGEVERWSQSNKQTPIDDFVGYDETSVKWSSTLKDNVRRGRKMVFDQKQIVEAISRPFCKMRFYYDPLLIHRPGAYDRYLPTNKPNRIICINQPANSLPFHVLMTDVIPDLHLTGDSQCFPLYTYSLDGSGRFENVTSYALESIRDRVGLEVSREDVFYATYALLHHPAYRARYGENLKRELPRLPLELLADAQTFAQWARIGRALGDLHVGYESAAPYPLTDIDTTPPGQKYGFRVERMRFSSDKTRLVVNASITLSGFTPEMFAYKLGNRSALDWVVESYRLKRDERSGLTSDPNRPGEPKFIPDLVRRVATVSLETMRLVGELPPLFEGSK